MKASKYSDPKYLGQKFHKLTVDKFVGFNKNSKYIWHVKCECGNEKDMLATEVIHGKVKSCGKCSIRESIGKRFGKLTVIKFVGFTNNHNVKFECQCDCGNITIVSLGNLKSGNVKSCRRCNTRDMIGRKFGSLTVVEYIKGTNNPMKYKCKCDCGNEVIVSGVSLRSGNTTTCNHCSRYKLLGKQIGHLKVVSIESEDIGKIPTFRCKCDCGNEVVRSMTSLRASATLSDNPDDTYCGECYHGLPDSYKPEIKERCLKLSNTWTSMYNRCCNANSTPFYQYGGRGIELKISQFEFVKMYYLENIDNMTIDRIDNNGHYEESNMRWVPQSVNNGNRVWSYDLTYNDIASRLLTITSFKSMKNVVHDNRLEFYKIVFNKDNEYGNTLNLFVHESMKDQIHYFINRIISLFTKFGYSGELKYTHIYKVRTVNDSKYGTFSSSIDAIDTEIEYISEEEFYAH